jgi:Protein of unknown function (DUF5131)
VFDVKAQVNGISVTAAVGKIDEAHMYKNKARVCNIEELSCPNSSQRAEDLTLKLRILRQRRRDEALAAGIPAGKVVERVATFATGTPIANSLGELWVMQSYLRPDLLRAAGVDDLGDWGAAFTATVTTVEVNSTGTRLRPVTRVGKFTNLPELLALSSAYSDVVTRDQVPVALPELATGQRRIISLQPDVEVTDFIADLGYRADHLDARRPDPDNVLKISSDGRNASLDPRLAHLAKPTHSRAAAVAEDIMQIHTPLADRVYQDRDTGAPLARTGPLQIVFCDRGTPSKKPGQFTIYQAIKDELIQRGMSAEAVRFVHEARKPAELKALFAQCNRGEVAVLIGSTEKMGTGAFGRAELRFIHCFRRSKGMRLCATHVAHGVEGGDVMSASKIEWTEVTWNPTTGYDRISSGCDNNYAMTMAKRLACRAGAVPWLVGGIGVVVAARSHGANVSVLSSPWSSQHRPTPCGLLGSRTAHRREGHRAL